MALFSLMIFLVLAGMAASEMRGLSAARIQASVREPRVARRPARAALSSALSPCAACP